jgi:hypothetical protein
MMTLRPQLNGAGACGALTTSTPFRGLGVDWRSLGHRPTGNTVTSPIRGWGQGALTTSTRSVNWRPLGEPLRRCGKRKPGGRGRWRNRLPRTLTRMQKLDGCRMSLRAGEIVEAVSCGVVLAVHQGPEACIALELAVICAAHQGP